MGIQASKIESTTKSLPITMASISVVKSRSRTFDNEKYLRCAAALVQKVQFSDCRVLAVTSGAYSFMFLTVTLLLRLPLLTFSGVAQLATHNNSITAVPRVITHCAPQIVQTDLYSAFIWYVTSRQSQTSSAWSYVTKLRAVLNKLKLLR